MEFCVRSKLPPQLSASAPAVAATICSGVAPSTAKPYAAAFAKFVSFAAASSVEVLPPDPFVVVTFLQAQLHDRKNLGCVTAAVASINFVVKACGLPALPQGQFDLVVAAARKLFARDVKRSSELTPPMVAAIARAMLHDAATEDDVRLGLAICWSFLAGARWSDLDRLDLSDVTIEQSGLTLKPSRRKNTDATKRSPKLREMFVAAFGGETCAAAAFIRAKVRFGWSTGPLVPWAYSSHLRRLRSTLRSVCGLSEAEAATFGTHAGRRGAAVLGRTGGAEPRAIRAFGGVVSDAWEDVYCDSVLPAERRQVARLVAAEVATL